MWSSPAPRRCESSLQLSAFAVSRSRTHLCGSPSSPNSLRTAAAEFPTLSTRALQLVPGDAEMPGPVVHFVRLAHGNMAAVALALVKQIVTHGAVLTGKTPPGG